jgi:polar amino acid transport system substrate-binding protein
MIKVVKNIGMLLSTLAIMSFINVASAAPSSHGLASIIAKGELVLGTSANMPPMTQLDKDGKPVGFDVDLASLVAQGMQVDLKVKVMQFDKLVDALEKGDVDIVISNMTMNPRRNLRVAFVGPYMTSGKCLVTKEQNIAEEEDISKLNVPDMKIVVLKGSTSEDIVNTLMPDVTAITVEDHAAGVALVANDKAGAMLADYPVCLMTIKNNPDKGFVSVFSLLTYEPIGIAVPADAHYINWMTNFLERLDKTLTLEVLAKKWLGELLVDTTREM